MKENLHFKPLITKTTKKQHIRLVIASIGIDVVAKTNYEIMS